MNDSSKQTTAICPIPKQWEDATIRDAFEEIGRMNAFLRYKGLVREFVVWSAEKRKGQADG